MSSSPAKRKAPKDWQGKLDHPQGVKERFQAIFESMSEGAAVHRLIYNDTGTPCDYELIEVNPAFQTHTGIDPVRAVGTPASKLYQSDPPPFLEIYSQVALTGQPVSFQSHVAELDRHFKVSVSSPEPGWFTTLFTDITDRMRIENETRRMNRLYLFLSQVNWAVVQATSKEQLFNRVCEISVEQGGFKLAWIGMSEKDSHRFIPVATAGETLEYLSKIAIYDDERPEGLGPTGTCFRENRPYICNDFAGAPSTSPWQTVAAQFGLRSSISVPIRRNGTPYAALMVYSGEKNYFQQKEVQLLEEVAASLAFALDHLDQEILRQKAETALSESETKFRVLFETSRDAILIINEERVLDCNSAAITLFGSSSKEELLSQPPWELSPPTQPDGSHSHQSAIQRNRAAMVEGNQFFEWTHQRKDGSLFVVEVMLTRIFLAGELVIQSVVRDISARKAAERELLNLSRAVEQSPVSIVITDINGCIEYVNPKFTALTGYELNEALGQNPRILQSGNMPAQVYEDLWKTVSAGKEWRGDLQNRKKNGDLYWESASISPLANKRGEVVKYLAVKEDITEKRERQASIAESEERFRQLTENLESVFWMASTSTNALLYVSPAYEKIWGRTCQSLYDEPESWLSAIHSEDRPRMEAIYRAEPANRSYDETYRIRRPDGSLRWVHDRAFLIHDSEGNPYRVAGIAEDITAAKLMNEQFLRAQRMESIGTLASGVAHDLNNVLAPIMMAGSMLKDNYPDSFGKELVATIEESAQRGSEIIKQVLTFARGIGGVQTNLAPEHLITQVGRIIEKTFPKTIRFSQKIPDELWTISADLTQLHQVLLNLCINARDAMPGGGSLLLAAENVELDEIGAATFVNAKAGRYVVLKVSDTGTGISEEMLEKIFDPFFTTKLPGHGTGLGLSTAMGIVKNHHGFIKVSSELGKGTLFEIYLPATTSNLSSYYSQNADQSLPQGNGAGILLVDDEQSIRSVTSQMLARNGYQVLLAKDGVEAMAVYCSDPSKIDLVITDVIMPQMDGIILTQALLKLNPTLPIIISSGHAEESHRKALESLPVKSFLRKPYSAAELFETLESLRVAKNHPSAGH